MKKRVIGLFLAGILAASALVGCGGGSSAESTDAGATEEAATAAHRIPQNTSCGSATVCS